MNPDDDPEQRIRQLEQPLADAARASELGGTQPPGYNYTPPPPPPPTYGYGGVPYTGASPRSSNRVFWVVGGFFVIGMLVLVGGIAAFAMHQFSRGGPVVSAPTTSTSTPRASSPPRTTRTSAAPSATSPPSATVPETPTPPTSPAGATVTLSGVGQNETIACNDNIVTVSGVSNTIVITGHCTSLSVSGVKNSVTVDAVDSIQASGLNNQVTFHTGSPKINKSGQGNVVQQG
jgi:hypothetical protein